MSKNVFNLIKFLKVNADDFYDVLRTPDAKKYKTFTIKKKNGKDRLIEAPIDDRLIHIQKRIKLFLDEEYEKFANKHVFGYVKGKSIVDNAREHFIQDEHLFIVKIDLKDFFNTITIERVINLLNKGLKISRESSNAIALLVTKERHLPQGGITSPVISNMICKKMDRELANYANSLGAVYSRYVDDIFFSFMAKDDAYQILDETQLPTIGVNETLKSIIQRNGFTINHDKVKLLSHNKRQNICGIVINEKINVKRSLIRDIRIKLHKLESGDNSINKKSLIGKISFARFVRGKKDSMVNVLCKRINALTIPPFPDADFRINERNAFNKYLVRLENGNENELSNDYGTGFFANGYLVTSKHVVEYKKTDPFSGDRGYFKKLSISYYDDNNHFCVLVVNVIEALTFCEVAFLKIDAFETFKNKCLKLSETLSRIPIQAICCGCQINDSSGLGVLSSIKSIIGDNNYYDAPGYTLERGSIVKGMSGAPLLDTNNYKVIGVNLSGDTIDGKNEINSVASVIDNRTIKNAKKWIPDDLWLLKHPEWK